jgi:hypothetical protein
MSTLLYKYNPKFKGIEYRGKNSTIFIDNSKIKAAIEKANSVIDQISCLEDVNIFATLGMRNLSAFIGEVFVASMASASDSLLRKNPHQDGYPDLLAMTTEGKDAWEKLSNNLRDKKPFSPFIGGGLEVKATCGSVPTPAILAKKNLHKPDIGDSRISMITGYDWKSHHRETNHLMGIFWDFIDQKPTIIALFYADQLSIDDWGKIIQPKDGGGRTTSVSIMTRMGVKKMYEGWIAAIDDPRYTTFLNKYNKDNLM